jgi:hypothetical protein
LSYSDEEKNMKITRSRIITAFIISILTLAGCTKLSNDRAVFPPKGTTASINILPKGFEVTDSRGEPAMFPKETRQGTPIENSKITIERFKVNPCFLRVCSPITGCRMLPAADEYCQEQ